MNPKKVDSEELRQFLVRNPCSDTTTWNDTQWVKLVCFYVSPLTDSVKPSQGRLARG